MLVSSMETSQFVNISLTTGDLDVHDSADLVSIGKDGVRQFVYPITLPWCCQ